MTCIVGIQGDYFGVGKSVIAGDSIGVGGYSYSLSNYPKVFQVGEFVIGYTTSFRFAQILQYHVFPKIEFPKDTEIGFGEIVTEVVEPMRRTLKELGFSTISENVETGGVALLGIRGQIFMIESDFNVQQNQSGFYAIGSGANYAMGALDALLENRKHTLERVATKAIETASKFSTWVSPPVTYITF